MRFADVARQRGVSTAVLVLKDPRRIFILVDTAASHRFYTPVATGGGAGARARYISRAPANRSMQTEPEANKRDRAARIRAGFA